MTRSVRDLRNSFDLLPERERSEAFSEILKRVQNFEHPPLDDETLAQIAEETSLMYDAEEAADGHG